MSLWTENQLTHKIYVLPKEIKSGVDINELLLKKLQNEVGDKCTDGYIKKDSIEILTRSIGKVDCARLNSCQVYNVTYKALVCDHVEDKIVEGKINQPNNMGAIMQVEPLSIVLPKQHHKNIEIFNGLNAGDRVRVKISGSFYGKNDTEINAVGLILEKLGS